ncbi:CDP-glycerol glycerophosphotransferase family protein [Oceanobacillus massiliensis]|uniref:CDP-glycerol glycerophosphotransferase family protein n=1 Tax=Oceanobacillus massiliensis TaxID=1465765 RepID=UPI0030193C68
MFGTSIDSKNIEILSNEKTDSSITNLAINGSFLDIEGYASVRGILTTEEERIRKTLLIAPRLDIENFRMENPDLAELTDDEIIERNLIQVAMDNCKLSSLNNKENIVIDQSMESLAGFQANVDLSTINKGKPLSSGEYDIYVKLEQLPNDLDNIRYEKIIPMSNIKNFLRNEFLTTKVDYFSAKKVLKYNLLISFDKYTKTLKLKSTLLQSYDPRELPDSEGRKEGRISKAFKRRFLKLFYILFHVFPIDKKKIVFASDSRSELNGNFYFVYEELYKRNLNLNIKFVFNERINNKKTLLDLIKAAYQFATAKIILLDDFYPMIYPLRIRNNADLIQIWHAAGAFKTFGYSRIGRPGGPSPTSRNHRNYSKATVSSAGVRRHYSEGFGIEMDKVYPTGIPRSDIFFDEEYKKYVKDTLYDQYPFLRNKKVILFAPTFRGNGQASAYYPFEVLNLKKLYDELNEDYVFLFKIHPFVKNKLNIPYEYSEFFHDLSDFREINDLLLVTDILITDYSSVCFEFALLKKPMLFFAYDVEKYIEERDFYYDYFDFIPGPILKNTSEIVDAINQKEFQMDKIQPFIRNFFDDTLGRASKNVVDQVIIPSLENKEIEEDDKDIATLEPPTSRIELFERAMKE